MSIEEQILEIPQNNFYSTHALVKKEVDDAFNTHDALYGIYDKHERYFSGETSKTLEQVKKSGLGWMDFWNYGKAATKIKQIVIGNQRTMLDSLFLSTPVFSTKKKPDTTKAHLYFLTDKKMRSEVGDHIASSLASAFEADGRMNQFVMDIEYPALAFGYSAVLYRDNDWIPDVRHPRHIAFPRGTKCDNIEKWVVWSKISAQKLYTIWLEKRKESASIETEDDSGKEFHVAGNYVLEGIEECLWNAFQDKKTINNTSSYVDWRDVVNDFPRSYQTIIQNTLDVDVAKLYNRELDGTLSETWINYDITKQASQNSSFLLFKKNHGAVTQDEVIVLVKDSGFTNNGEIAKLRGISKMAVEDGLRYDKTRNALANKHTVMGMPYIQTTGVNSNVGDSIEVTQGFGLLKQGTTFVEKQPVFDLSSHISMLNFQEQEYRSVSKDFDPSIEGKLSNRPTKGEVSAISGEAASMEMAKASVKLSDYTKVISMMLKGLCEAMPQDGSQGQKSQRIFFEKLIYKLSPYGVTKKEQCVDIIKEIEYMPMSYYGMSLDTLRTMMTMADTPASRIRIQRMMMLRMGVPRNEIDLHAPYEESGYRSLEDEALVAIENVMFQTTTNVVYSDSHDPTSHLDGHYGQVMENFQGVAEEQIDPVTAFKWSANILEHCQLHLTALERNPFYKSRLPQYRDAQKNMMENIVELRMLAERETKARMEMEQKAQQQQDGIDPVQRAKIDLLEFQAMKKEERRQFLTQVNMQGRQEQQAFNNNLKTQAAAHSMNLREQESKQRQKMIMLESLANQITR